MRTLKYIGPSPGPVLSSEKLGGTYDFSSSPVQQVSAADAEVIRIYCGRLFRDITDASIETFVLAREADSTVPVLASATVVSKVLTLAYTESFTLDSEETAEPSDFAVLVNAAPNTVKKVSTSGKAVTLILTTAVVHGDTVTIGYTRQTSGAKQIKDVNGNKAANLVAQAVTNNTPDVTAPVLASAVVTGANLVLTYTDTSNLHTTNKAAPSAFTVTVDAVERAVNSNTVNGAAKTCTLVLASAVTAGQTVVISYTAPNTTAATQDTAGNKAASFTNQAVTNSTT